MGAQQEGSVAVKRPNFQHVPELLLQEAKPDAGLIQPVAVLDEISVESVHYSCLATQSQSLCRKLILSHPTAGGSHNSCWQLVSTVPHIAGLSIISILCFSRIVLVLVLVLVLVVVIVIENPGEETDYEDEDEHEDEDEDDSRTTPSSSA